MELKIGGKYKIIRKIGKGAYGQIFLGANTLTAEEIAIKIEPTIKESQCLYESKIYRILQEGTGIPKLY